MIITSTLPLLTVDRGVIAINGCSILFISPELEPNYQVQLNLMLKKSFLGGS